LIRLDGIPEKEEAPAAGRGFVEGLRRSIDEEVERRPCRNDRGVEGKFQVFWLNRQIS
jgi:hypothetical protein